MCCRLLACAVIALCLVTPASAQLENVGNISFPTSAKPEAQRHFLRGVAILHSFGWKQAIAEFQAAQKAQPDFALAYWGESLSYNHPLNSQMDFKEPRAVLARLGPDRASRVAKAPTDREKGFMNAVEDLWGEGDSRQRRIAYMTAMERLYQQFPADDEVKTFYALSILSAASAVDDRTARMNVKAGTLAMDVFKRNPNHPGAVHYIIHAFDDPIHAPLALEAAHVYAKIVPAVSHAIHMPTHIFIQHGMWNLVANQNIRAYNVAKELWQPGDVPGDMAHSGAWGQYGFLQMGDYAGARERIQAFEWMATTTKNPRANSALALVRARYIIESEEWKVQPLPENASNETILANGFSAVKTGDIATAEKMAAVLSEKRKVTPRAAAPANPHAEHGGAPAPAPVAPMTPGGPDSGKGVSIMHNELQALIAQAKGQTDQAIALLKEAVEWEESMRPPNGAADPIKPSHELLGEVLLAAGKHKEAADAFEASLLRMPNRSRSLMGAIKAHLGAGNKQRAAERQATLNSFWKGKPFSATTTDPR
ncbi:MAG TPA: tetratricopeptide repeat protein [Vicinamibacterales bacterium]|nr:tetratricopeptide repeat protein [Vicinamibacterales bacterium]